MEGSGVSYGVRPCGQAGSYAVNPAGTVRIAVGRDYLSDHGRVGTRVAVPWCMLLRKVVGCAPQRSLKGVTNHASALRDTLFAQSVKVADHR